MTNFRLTGSYVLGSQWRVFTVLLPHVLIIYNVTVTYIIVLKNFAPAILAT